VLHTDTHMLGWRGMAGALTRCFSTTSDKYVVIKEFKIYTITTVQMTHFGS